MLTKVDTLDAMVIINQNFHVPYNGINCDYLVEVYEGEHYTTPLVTFKCKDADHAVRLQCAIDDCSDEILIHGGS